MSTRQMLTVFAADGKICVLDFGLMTEVRLDNDWSSCCSDDRIFSYTLALLQAAQQTYGLHPAFCPLQ